MYAWNTNPYRWSPCPGNEGFIGLNPPVHADTEHAKSRMTVARGPRLSYKPCLTPGRAVPETARAKHGEPAGVPVNQSLKSHPSRPAGQKRAFRPASGRKERESGRPPPRTLSPATRTRCRWYWHLIGYDYDHGRQFARQRWIRGCARPVCESASWRNPACIIQGVADECRR